MTRREILLYMNTDVYELSKNLYKIFVILYA